MTTMKPVGWEECKLSDILSLKNGFAFKSSEYKDAGVPILRISDIQGGLVSPSNAKCIDEHESFDEYVVGKGDILIAMSGATTGKFGIYDSPLKAYQNQRVGRFSVYSNELISNSFVYYLLFSLKREIEKSAYGGAQPNISSSKIESLNFLLPPTGEQARIVNKIEELFSELDKGIESLKMAKAQLAVYRQALLKHAFEGKLTEQWRKDNTDKLESPEQLLARIQQEREDCYQQYLEDWKSAVDQWESKGKEGKKPTKPKKPKIFPTLEPKDIAALPVLPDNWQWIRLGNLINGSAQNGIYKPSSDYGQGKYIVRIDDFYDGSLVKKDSFKRLSLTKEELKTYSLEPNDILVNRVNSIEYLGKCCEIPELDEPIVFESNIMKFKVLNDFIKGNYLTSYLSSFSGKNRICDNAKHAVNQASINQTDVGMTPVPICCFDEQNQIADTLEQKLSVVERELSNIEINLKKSDILRQSILKKAFSGQLVTQDLSDEPASELLKKIVIEKAELAAKEKEDKAAAKKAKTEAKKTKA